VNGEIDNQAIWKGWNIDNIKDDYNSEYKVADCSKFDKITFTN